MKTSSHRSADVLDALLKNLHGDAKDALAKIYCASSRTAALEPTKVFADTFASFGRATAKITGDLDVLLAFYDFPVEHWIHLRRPTRSRRPSRPCVSGPR